MVDGSQPEAAPIGPATTKPTRSSIDLSLELERQLESDSAPNSPSVPTTIQDDPAHASLDPRILAHIITQLRDSLAKMTNERDDLILQLAESHSRIAEFKDSLEMLTDRCARLESDLEVAKKQHQDDEEAISMLRSKVEESRRGLMRLQTERNNENKRMTLDTAHIRSPSLRSSNRTSFTPLTGSGIVVPPSSYRRTTAVSDNDPGFAEFVASLPGSPGHIPLSNPLLESTESSTQNRRRSMFGSLGRSSLGQMSVNSEGRRSVSPSMAEMESLKRELAATKTELEETRHELTESNEAREASESCVKALRDYISQVSSEESQQVTSRPNTNSEAGASVKLPSRSNSTSSWGLKLWRVDTSTSSLSQSSNTQRSPPDNELSPSTAVPLRDKLGSLFSRGTPSVPNPHLRPAYHQDEPILNGSDVSSVSEASEPVSPPQESPELVLQKASDEGIISHKTAPIPVGSHY